MENSRVSACLPSSTTWKATSLDAGAPVAGPVPVSKAAMSTLSAISLSFISRNSSASDMPEELAGIIDDAAVACEGAGAEDALESGVPASV